MEKLLLKLLIFSLLLGLISKPVESKTPILEYPNLLPDSLEEIMGNLPDGVYEVNENELLSFVSIYGPYEGEELGIVAYDPTNNLFLPSGAIMNNTNDTSQVSSSFSWIPTQCQSGQKYTFNATFNVTHSFDIWFFRFNILPDWPLDSQTIFINVINQNREPVITTSLPPVKYLQIGQSWDMVLNAEDEDYSECEDDNLTWSITSPDPFPGELVSTGIESASYHWAPSLSDVGSYTFTFRIEDEKGGFDERTVYVNVYEQGYEQTLESVDEGQLLSFARSTGISTGDNMSIMPLTPLPAGASFLPNTAMDEAASTFTWTPDYCSAGTEYVEIEYYNLTKDPDKPWSTETVDITVNNVNRDPAVVATTSTGSLLYSFYSVPIGTEASITFTKSDLDRDICSDDTVNFVNQSFESSYETEAAWTSSGDEMIWTWTPTVEGDLGTHRVSAEVMDSHGATYKETITVSAYRPSTSRCTPYSPKYRFPIEPPRGRFCMPA